MDLDVRSLLDIRTLLGVISALEINASGGPTASVLSGSFPSLVRSAVFPRSGTVPQWCIADLGGEVLVQSYGVSSAAQAVALVASAGVPMKSAGSWSADSMTLDVAEYFYRTLLTWLPTMGRRFTLVGYSFGGAVVEVLAALIADRQPAASVQVLSAGAPRPGGVSLQQRLSSLPVVRLFNDTDPIPRFPFHLLEGPLACLAAGFLTSLFWSQYVQPAGGVEIDQDGRFTIRPLPGRSVPAADLNVVRWLTGTEGTLSAGHYVRTYQQRIQSAIVAGTTHTPGSLPLPSAEPIQGLTESAFVAVRTSPAAAEALLEEGRTVSAFVPPDYRAGVLKLSPTSFAVLWMGEPIVTDTNRSHARTVAKFLNAFMRRLQPTKEVFQGRLANALSLYLAKAGNPTAGFNPTMNLIP